MDDHFSTRFNSEEHQIIENAQCIESLKRDISTEIKNKLFLYYHLKEKCYVIAVWINRPYFADMLNMGTSPSNLDRSMYQNLLWRLTKPEYNQQIARFMKDAEDDAIRQKQAKADEAGDRLKHQIDRKILVAT